MTPHRNTRWSVLEITGPSSMLARFPVGLTLDVALDLYDPFQLRECWHEQPLRAGQFCGTCEVRSC